MLHVIQRQVIPTPSCKHHSESDSENDSTCVVDSYLSESPIMIHHSKKSHPYLARFRKGSCDYFFNGGSGGSSPKSAGFPFGSFFNFFGSVTVSSLMLPDLTSNSINPTSALSEHLQSPDPSVLPTRIPCLPTTAPSTMP